MTKRVLRKIAFEHGICYTTFVFQTLNVMEGKSMEQQYHPSNVLKFCPFCGASGFSWDGEKSHLCCQCGHRLYTNQAAAVVAIIENKKGELLLTRRKFDPKKGTLDLPGGFVDLGEKAEDAVGREVKEELNLEVGGMEYFGSFPNQYVFGGLTYFTLDLAFRCTVSNFSSIQAADDVEAYIFYSPDRLKLADIGLDSIREIVRQYCSIK